MKPPADESIRLPTRPGSTPAQGAGDFPPNPVLALIEGNANATANDWQIIHQLKTLFEHDPALISSLLEDPDSAQPDHYASTLMAAAREALRTRPGSADLHYHAAKAALRIGETRDAADLLEQALQINPCHVAASVLLSDVCLILKEPQRAVAWPQRALALGAVRPDAPPAGRSRRGNELFT